MPRVDVDCLELHPFAAPPTSDEFLRASLRSAHAWVRQTAQVSQRPAVQKLLEHNEFGVMLAGVYLDNMAKHTGTGLGHGGRTRCGIGLGLVCDGVDVR